MYAENKSQLRGDAFLSNAVLILHFMTLVFEKTFSSLDVASKSVLKFSARSWFLYVMQIIDWNPSSLTDRLLKISGS